MEYTFDAVFNTFTDTAPIPQVPPLTNQNPSLPTRKTKSKKKFTPEEDKIIIEQVKARGEKGWKHIAENVPGRTARQCRERWVNYLSPNVSLAPWTKEEDELLTKLVSEFGQQWSKISSNFKFRTDVMLKNRWSNLKSHTNVKPASVVKRTNNAVPSEPINLKPKIKEENVDFSINQASEIWIANEQLIENNVDEFEVFSWMD